VAERKYSKLVTLLNVLDWMKEDIPKMFQKFDTTHVAHLLLDVLDLN